MDHFLEGFAGLCCFGLFLYKWIIILAILISWVNADPHNHVVVILNRITRPLWVWCEHRLPVMWAHFSAYISILLIIFAQVVLPASILSLNLFVFGDSNLSDLLNQGVGHILQGGSIVAQSALFFIILILIVWFFLGVVNSSINNPVVRVIHFLADPVITPIQRYLPRTKIDWSPVVGILFFYFVSSEIITPIGFYGRGLSLPVTICSY